jgi:ribosomal protein S27E
MKLEKALELVLALATENMLEDEIVEQEPELKNEQNRQLEAISTVQVFIAWMRGDKTKKLEYDVKDVINAEFNLEPLKCRHCGSYEVTYHDSQGDAYCAACGYWQLDKP